MRDYKSLSHSRWDCKYHIVFILKYRQKVVYGSFRSYIGEMLHELASHRESKIEEGHMMGAHNPYVHQYSAKVSGIESSGLHQREKCDYDFTEIWQEGKELQRRKLLGQRIFRFNNRFR